MGTTDDKMSDTRELESGDAALLKVGDLEWKLGVLTNRVETLERERDEAKAAAAKVMEGMPGVMRKHLAKIMGGGDDDG